jgi:hypothetical protein
MTTEDQKINHQAIHLLYEKNLYRIDQRKPDAQPAAAHHSEQPAVVLNHPATASPVVVVSRTKLTPGSGSSNLLELILKACQLQPESVPILSPLTPDITADGLKTNYQPAHVLMFGIGSSEIGLTVYFPDYQAQKVGGIQYLTAPDLMILESDPDAKQKLWKSLKTAFSLT